MSEEKDKDLHNNLNTEENDQESDPSRNLNKERKMSEEKNKISHDDLDMEEIDQLHNAVLQMSKSCFEYKKICVGLLGAVIALIVKFSDEPLTNTLFIVSMAVVISFWLADSTAYYYQTATRIRMNNKRMAIAVRNSIDKYEVKKLELSLSKSLFNGSMTLYYSLSVIIAMAWASSIYVAK